MCQKLKLIFEVDGYSHNFKTEGNHERNRIVNQLGFTVIRFTDAEVMPDLPNVQRTREIWIEENRKQNG